MTEAPGEKGLAREGHEEGTDLKRRGEVAKGQRKGEDQGERSRQRRVQGERGHQRKGQGEKGRQRGAQGEGTLLPPPLPLKTVAEDQGEERRSTLTKLIKSPVW